MERIRDTALFFKRFHPWGKTPGLRDLALWNLELEIQQGSHDSVSFLHSKVSTLYFLEPGMAKLNWCVMNSLPNRNM
jgi:hypothetical protein